MVSALRLVAPLLLMLLASCSVRQVAAGTPADAPRTPWIVDHPHPVVRAVSTLWVGTKAFWVDDDRVIFSTPDDASGQAMPLGELARIVILDTATGQAHDTPYRGTLRCYSAQRMLVDSRDADRRSIRLAGPPDGPLVALEGKLAPTAGPGCADTLFGADGFATIPLEPGDGALRTAYGAKFAGDARPFDFVDASGRTTSPVERPRNTRLLGHDLQAMPWSPHRYLDAGAFAASRFSSQDPGAYIDAQAARVEPLAVPYALSQMAEMEPGSGVPIATRAGLLWMFRPGPSHWRDQGLYLQVDAGTVPRVDDHEVSGVAVSPDGCKVFYGRIAGRQDLPNDAYLHRRKYDAVVLDICATAGVR